MFARLGRWCHDHRWVVLGAWLVVIVLSGSVLGRLGTESRSEFTLPDVESRHGLEILEDSFGGIGAGQSGTILFLADGPVTDPAVQQQVQGVLDDIAALDDELVVRSPFAPGGEAQIAARGPHAGELAYAQIDLPAEMTFEESQELITRIEPLTDDLEGVEVVLGGEVFSEFEEPSSEVLGIGFAVFILILAFGSVLAMGLPIGVALFGIGLGSILVGLLSHVATIPDFATVLGVMIGLGVGIDYALFIVTRYRENLHEGHDTRRATVVAVDTAGRAVVFAGTTVVISLLGMLIMNISFVTGLAIGAASVVAVTMVASVTLLPALLGFAGERVEVTRWRGLLAAGCVASALVLIGIGLPPVTGLILLVVAVLVLLASVVVSPLRHTVTLRTRKPHDQTFSYRWSRAVQHHPVRSLLVGGTVLLVMALPAIGLRLGFADEGNYPEGTDTREAYDLLAAGFGPGFNGPLLLAARVPAGTDPAVFEQITAAVEDDPGVAGVTPAIPDDGEDPSAVIWRIIPTSAPQDEATGDLVARLRSDVLPEASEGAIDVAVTGSVAVGVDFSAYLAGRLPWFFAAVLSLSFLLLMVVFRSLLVPLKAVLMNLLSIAAAYGILVAGFQWGWLGEVMGFDGAPIEPFMPMMLFAIVFGLSMDYEVFLLSRVKEEWDRTGDSHESVANGLAATARVITAAALIMVFVFGSFLLEDDRVIKLFGTGLATAVLLDATIVRMLLVPATMELLGDRNWWLPGWLDRILPRVDVEGHHEIGAATPVAEGDDADPVDPDDVELEPVGAGDR